MTRAILLAAGLGTRLRPLTYSIPKCLVPINGQPLLDIWLETLTRASIGPFLINTHYLARQVEAYVRASPYRQQVTLVHESKLLGTAGTLIANLGFFEDEDGMLIHADNYCMADFRAFVQAHHQRPPDCLMTMMTFRTDDPVSCGIVELDDLGVVKRFHEKVHSPPGNLANGAIYLLSRNLIRLLAAEFSQARDFSTEVLYPLVGRIHTYETDRLHADVGTQRVYEKLNRVQSTSA